MTNFVKTGKAAPEQYVLGRGILSFSPRHSNGTLLLLGPFEDLGNCTELTATIESEVLEHQSLLGGKGGVSVIDKEILQSTKMRLSFTLDELKMQNVARFLFGDAVTGIANPVRTKRVTGGSNLTITCPDITSVALANSYLLTDAADGTRCWDIDTALRYGGGNNESQVVVRRDPAGANVLCVEGTDYELDHKTGSILFLATATNVSNGHVVRVTIRPHEGAGTAGDPFPMTLDRVRAMKTTSIIGTLRFKGINPAANDREYELQFHQVSMKPNGDMSLIGDDWANMPFECVVEADTVNNPDSPFCTVLSLTSAT